MDEKQAATMAESMIREILSDMDYWTMFPNVDISGVESDAVVDTVADALTLIAPNPFIDFVMGEILRVDPNLDPVDWPYLDEILASNLPDSEYLAYLQGRLIHPD